MYVERTTKKMKKTYAPKPDTKTLKTSRWKKRQHATTADVYIY